MAIIQKCPSGKEQPKGDLQTFHCFPKRGGKKGQNGLCSQHCNQDQDQPCIRRQEIRLHCVLRFEISQYPCHYSSLQLFKYVKYCLEVPSLQEAIRTSFALDNKLYLARLSPIRDRLEGSVCAKLGVLPLDDLVTGVGPFVL